MKITLETWNSVDFKRIEKTETKITSRRLTTPDNMFSLFKKYNQSGLHRGYDESGAYFGWPNTGYDMPTYRVRIESNSNA